MYRIENITKGHKIKAFDCGEATLNGFLKSFALKNDSHNIGRTFVAIEDGDTEVKGYYTLSAGSVKSDNFPADLKLPKYPIPTAHLGRLATDLSVRGQRLGEALLFDALKRTALTSQALGIRAMELKALSDNAKSFYLKYGFLELADDPHHLYLTMETILELV